MPLGASRAAILGSGEGVANPNRSILNVYQGTGSVLSSVTNPFLGGTTASWTGISNKIVAFSRWIKLPEVNTRSTLFSAGEGTIGITLRDGGIIRFQGVFSDAPGVPVIVDTTHAITTSWAHFYLIIDTTQATEANRVRMYVNGTLSGASSGGNTPGLDSTFDETGGNVAWPDSHISQFANGSSPTNDNDIYYQFATFSGIYPSAATIYNGGSPLNLTGQAGLFSNIQQGLTDLVTGQTWHFVNDALSLSEDRP